VAFGGDHSITFPTVQAYQEELDVVHFDSHLDFTDDYRKAGLRYTHGNPLKRTSELENVDKITQIGIRGLLNPKFVQKEAQKYGTNIITAEKALKHGIRWIINQIPESENLYVTLDIDILDPSVAPGTGTPEPGGFNYLQVKEILTRLPEKGNIVGFDVVEVNPLYDVGDMTSQVAARLALDFLGSIFHRSE
jgi:agmatinase